MYIALLHPVEVHNTDHSVITTMATQVPGNSITIQVLWENATWKHSSLSIIPSHREARRPVQLPGTDIFKVQLPGTDIFKSTSSH